MECDYEWTQHETFARVVGLQANEIEAVRTAPEPDTVLPGVQGTALKLTRQLVESGTAEAVTVQRLLAETSEQQLVELILAVVTYQGLATLMNALAIDPEAAISSTAAAGVMGDG